MLISLDTWRKQRKETALVIAKSVEASTLGKVVDECSRLADMKGLTGDYTAGYRKACADVTAFILASLKDLK